MLNKSFYVLNSFSEQLLASSFPQAVFSRQFQQAVFSKQLLKAALAGCFCNCFLLSLLEIIAITFCNRFLQLLFPITFCNRFLQLLFAITFRIQCNHFLPMILMFQNVQLKLLWIHLNTFKSISAVLKFLSSHHHHQSNSQDRERDYLQSKSF